MIPAVDIRHDLDGLSARLGLMAKERLAAALSAINKTMTTVRAEAARGLGQEYPGLGIGAIKRRIKLTRASRGNLRAAAVFSKSRLRLFNWRLNRVNTRWGTGVRVSGRLPRQILRVDAISGRVSPVSSSELKSAFLQRSRKNGTPNVWLRQGKESMPIDVLVTPSLSETLVATKLNAAYARRARERFRVVFAQEAKFKLSKR